MSNEQQQIIDEAYKRYHSQTIIKSKDLKDFEELDGMDLGTGEWKKVHRQYAPKEFINKCKTDPEFSEKWGLQIEEKELSLEERVKIQMSNVMYSGRVNFEEEYLKEVCDKNNVPTRLITITYKEQTIESYE